MYHCTILLCRVSRGVRERPFSLMEAVCSLSCEERKRCYVCGIALVFVCILDIFLEALAVFIPKKLLKGI